MNLRLLASAAAAALALTATPAMALGLAVDTGWTYDQIDGAFQDSQDSPVTFTLSSNGVFRLTDAFVTGDTFFVYDSMSNTLLATSSLFATGPLTPAGDPTGEAAWENGAYQHLELFLGAGSYSFDIQGDGAGGVPAGLYIRADTAAAGVPEPATWALMLTGFFGAGAVLRGRRRAAFA